MDAFAGGDGTASCSGTGRRLLDSGWSCVTACDALVGEELVIEARVLLAVVGLFWLTMAVYSWRRSRVDEKIVLPVAGDEFFSSRSLAVQVMARRYGISRWRIRYWIFAGRVEAMRLDGRAYIDETGLAEAFADWESRSPSGSVRQLFLDLRRILFD